jgi:hypothetical protein
MVAEELLAVVVVLVVLVVLVMGVAELKLARDCPVAVW